MNNKSDPRVTFEPELVLHPAGNSRRTWLPTSAGRDQPVAHAYWLTRASRGISWHRTGRALVREQFR
ncbi:MAG: hypothetical protein ACJ8R9_19615 [Steroidobacteraceae bacterium]